jgi:hypothetical protein
MSVYESDPGEHTAPAARPEVQASEAEPALELPPAVQRFKSCRWRKAVENGVPDHCTHRDVQPMAGTMGFAPEAWCIECGHYKVRRNPRKRPAIPPEDRYYY